MFREGDIVEPLEEPVRQDHPRAGDDLERAEVCYLPGDDGVCLQFLEVAGRDAEVGDAEAGGELDEAVGIGKEGVPIVEDHGGAEEEGLNCPVETCVLAS